MIELRPYQQDAIDAVYRYLRKRDDNPCVVIPTAGGKTPVLATICRDAVTRWNGRVIVLAHVKELLEQAVDKLKAVCPDLDVGVYSAGLRRRDTEHQVIVAGIQSVYKRACELDAFNLAIVDESHTIPTEGDGMYRQFLTDAKAVNPELRIIGFTGTPYRMKSGLICAPDHFLNNVCYEVGVRELIHQGYLSPLNSKAGVSKVDTSQLHIRAGEFVTDEVERLVDQDHLVEAACDEIVEYMHDRSKCLIFAASVAHAQHVARVLHDRHGIECGFVCGNTPSDLRDELIARFRDQSTGNLFHGDSLKYMVNIDVLSVGFDCPAIDTIVLLRPSNSPGWYCQAVGRGFRLHPGKENCLILDFAGNIERHGPVDQIKIKSKLTNGSGEPPAKECPDCHSVIAAGYATCPDCGFEFPPPEKQKHEATASQAGILSGQVTLTKYEVRDITFSVHTKRGAEEDSPKTMRVDYRLGLDHWQSEWICFEHMGYARRKAVAWWKQRSPDPVPDTAEEAVDIANSGGVAYAESITVRSVAGEPYDRIVDYELGEVPEEVAAAAYDLDELPF